MEPEVKQFIESVLVTVRNMRNTRQLPHQFEMEAITQTAEYILGGMYEDNIIDNSGEIGDSTSPDQLT